MCPRSVQTFGTVRQHNVREHGLKGCEGRVHTDFQLGPPPPHEHIVQEGVDCDHIAQRMLVFLLLAQHGLVKIHGLTFDMFNGRHEALNLVGGLCCHSHVGEHSEC